MPTTRSLQELIIAAHFQVPLPLSVMDLASWVDHFEADYPLSQQLPALAQTQLPVPGVLQMPFQFMAVGPVTLPRMLARSPDGRYLVQLQNDRFAFGWQRTEPVGDPVEYPGFERIRDRWRQVLDQFDAWAQDRLRQRPAHRLIELSYGNAVPLERDGQQKRLSEIFTFVQPGSRKINGFNVNWVESVYPIEDGPLQPPKGIVNSAVAIGMSPPAIKVLAFTFTGLASVAPGEQSEHILDDVHARIREIYQGAIIPNAD